MKTIYRGLKKFLSHLFLSHNRKSQKVAMKTMKIYRRLSAVGGVAFEWQARVKP
jgi:hypothetical protein